MDHMIGKGWRDLFDVIITQARKPSFYHHQASRFVFYFLSRHCCQYCCGILKGYILRTLYFSFTISCSNSSFIYIINASTDGFSFSVSVTGILNKRKSEFSQQEANLGPSGY